MKQLMMTVCAAALGFAMASVVAPVAEARPDCGPGAGDCGSGAQQPRPPAQEQQRPASPSGHGPDDRSQGRPQGAGAQPPRMSGAQGSTTGHGPDDRGSSWMQQGSGASRPGAGGRPQGNPQPGNPQPGTPQPGKPGQGSGQPGQPGGRPGGNPPSGGWGGHDRPQPGGWGDGGGRRDRDHWDRDHWDRDRGGWGSGVSTTIILGSPDPEPDPYYYPYEPSYPVPVYPAPSYPAPGYAQPVYPEPPADLRIGASAYSGQLFMRAANSRFPPPPPGQEYRVMPNGWLVLVDSNTLAIVSILGLLSVLLNQY
ncbi:hypothetical protein [Paenirhodobacter enshiensis]|uniref:hypothetical protein n=1 Tax=Paenirhodobacter enshiensis TaxID=1105367 RepID=UPI0012693C3D|nr:hypothetical protein [Paenirhodobacter enshiensis]